MAKEKYEGQDYVRSILLMFFQSTDNFKKAYNLLDISYKKAVYVEALKDVSDAIQKYEEDVLKNYNHSKCDYSKIKQLSTLITCLDGETDQELFKEFYDFHHLINFELPILDNKKVINYLFNTGSSSELFDLNENKAKAIYHAVCSDNVNLLDRLFTAITMRLPDNTSNVTELYDILSDIYKRLKTTLSKEIKYYVRKKLDVIVFCYDTFKLLSEAEEIEKSDGPSSNVGNKRKQVTLNLIKSFANQPQELDKLILTVIARNIEILGLPISHKLRANFEDMIGILDRKDQFYWFKKMAEAIKKENEMKKIETKYIKLDNFKNMREFMVSQLHEFAKSLQPSPV